MLASCFVHFFLFNWSQAMGHSECQHNLITVLMLTTLIIFRRNHSKADRKTWITLHISLIFQANISTENGDIYLVDLFLKMGYWFLLEYMESCRENTVEFIKLLLNTSLNEQAIVSLTFAYKDKHIHTNTATDHKHKLSSLFSRDKHPFVLWIYVHRSQPIDACKCAFSHWQTPCTFVLYILVSRS